MSDLTAVASADRRTARTSAQGMVERAILVVFGVVRVGVVVQMAAAAISLSIRSEMPLGSWLMTVVAIAWSVGFFLVVLRGGSFASLRWWWGAGDVLIAVIALIVIGVTLPRGWQIGTWHAWDYAYSVVVAPTVSTWLRSRPGSLAVAAGLAVVYAATVLPGNHALASTIALNAASYLVFATAAVVLVPMMRGLARTADDSAEQAIRLAAELEQARYQFHIHNATGLLTRLAQEDTPDEILPSLREQARLEARRLRQEALRAPGRGRADAESVRTLDRVVHDAVAGFGHLPLEVRTALGRGVRLAYGDALVLQSALISVLYNVQFHAQAREVVVHADSDDTSWEVSVCDDGVGFDPARTAYGFGLQSQVLDSARRAGMSVEVRSQPGEGTCVAIRGCRVPLSHGLPDIGASSASPGEPPFASSQETRGPAEHRGDHDQPGRSILGPVEKRDDKG